MDWGAKIEGEGGPACIFLSIMTLQLGQWCSNLSSNKCNNEHVSFDHITQSFSLVCCVYCLFTYRYLYNHLAVPLIGQQI